MQQIHVPAKSHWLNHDRVSTYSRLFIYLYLIIGAGWIAFLKEGLDPLGKPFGYDFITFWSASYAWLHGAAADAYDVLKLFRIEQLAVPGNTKAFAWFYPPTFYLMVLPLALLPYIVSYSLFITVTFVPFLTALRRIAPDRQAIFLIAAFPGVFINAAHGQNAFITAALAGWAVILLERRPAVAGLLAGLLVIKPHLALLLPLVFLVSKRWRAAAYSILTMLLFTILSIAILGYDVLKAFLGSIQFARMATENNLLPWEKMPTFFAMMRLAGADLAWSYSLHIAFALLIMIAVLFMWKTSADEYLRYAALFTGTLLVSPYLFDYDLAWLAFPIAWIAQSAMKRDWLSWEREILLLAWLSPLIMPSIAKVTSLQVGPIITLALFLAIQRRAIHASNSPEK